MNAQEVLGSYLRNLRAGNIDAALLELHGGHLVVARRLRSWHPGRTGSRVEAQATRSYETRGFCVVSVTGSGAFCAGADLKELVEIVTRMPCAPSSTTLSSEHGTSIPMGMRGSSLRALALDTFPAQVADECRLASVTRRRRHRRGRSHAKGQGRDHRIREHRHGSDVQRVAAQRHPRDGCDGR